jgi:Hemerythrin HHE cation binding domain.
MVNIDTLRTQHDDALAMADRLIDLADNYDPRTAAIPILMQVNRLLGLLRVHLAHEDVELYPALIASADPHVARTAQRFVDEMGSLASDFEWFARHWSCSVSIAGNIDEFREGAHELMLALAVRIERENLYLYPLAEAEVAKQARRAA